MKKLVLLPMLAAMCLPFDGAIFAQQKLTREQILAMTTDELSELPLEDLMSAQADLRLWSRAWLA